MKRYICLGISCLLMSSLIACSDDNNPPDTTPPPGPEVPSLEATGTYSGTVETDAGDVSLMTFILARTGETVISFETDDSEKASIVLWGNSEGDESQITFEGSDTDTQASATVSLQVGGNTITGDLSLGNLRGTFSLEKNGNSDGSSSLDTVAGHYLRQDNAAGLTSLTIGTDGSAQLTGSCEASGTVAVIDEQVNIYSLNLSSSCIELDALLSMHDGEVPSDTILVTGSGGDHGISLAFYRD